MNDRQMHGGVAQEAQRPASVAHELDCFFSPASMAVIGASADHTKIRGRLFQMLVQNKYPGKLFPVNPSNQELAGLKCYPSIKAVGQPIDVALVAIPAKQVLANLEECVAAGVRHAVIISSGFAEEGGASVDMQRDIAALARRSGMRVCGPNAEGYYNEPGRVAATFSPTVDFKGDELAMANGRRVGVIAQSGGIGFSLLNRGKAYGLNFSHVISTGNEADLTAADFLEFMVADASTDVIAMFLESVRDPVRFVAAARRAAEIGKPIVVAKVGQSGAGARASASHTASMAGWNAAYEAVFAANGFIQAADADELVAIAAAFATMPTAKGNRAGVVTVSGGGGAWTADVLSANGFVLPELSKKLQDEIRSFIPSYGTAQNPVDVTAQAVQQGGVQRSIELLEESDEVDVVAVVLSMAHETRISFDVERTKALAKARRKPILFHTYTLPSLNARTKLAEIGLPLYPNLGHIGLVAKALYRRGQFKAAAARPVPRADAKLVAALKAQPAFSEYDAKTFLRQAGIPLPDERLVVSPDQLDAAMQAVGFPLALKIQSKDIPHKSEVGGIKLNIANADEGRAAHSALLAHVKAMRPSAAIQGVLISPMAKRGTEIIVGVVRDEVFGPMVMVGFGGVTTELFKDVVYRPAPLDAEQANAMLDALRAAPLLKGFRGAPPADVPALVDLVVKLSRLAATYRDHIAELELNPIVVHPNGQGITVLDALLAPARHD
jgi:acetate---CoA ligase (ADP-forming)